MSRHCHCLVLYLLLCSPCCLKQTGHWTFFKHMINKELPLFSAKQSVTFHVVKRYHFNPGPTVGMRLNQLRESLKLLKTKQWLRKNKDSLTQACQMSNHLLKGCALGWMSLLLSLLFKLLAGLLLLAYRLTLVKLIPYLCCWCQIHPFWKTQTALRIQNEVISTNTAIVPGVVKKILARSQITKGRSHNKQQPTLTVLTLATPLLARN